MKMNSSSSSLSVGSKTHTFSCISLILQRFLCSGTSSTYPSDQITKPGAKARGDEPGAVAKLMGLDSIPVIDKTRVVSRSRSVNSVDDVKRNNDEIQGKHGRVKPILDSYQLMKYVELEDDHFFILSFEKDRNEKSFGELKQLRKERRKNRRKRRENKLRQNIYKNNLINEEEEEYESCDDSSPVSVLDYDRFTSVVITPSPENNTSKRQLSCQLESSKPTIQEDHIKLTSKSIEFNVHDCQEMWLMICRLTVSELEGSNWVYRKASKFEDFEGIISEDIVSNILDKLLEETITTLSKTLMSQQYNY